MVEFANKGGGEAGTRESSMWVMEEQIGGQMKEKIHTSKGKEEIRVTETAELKKEEDVIETLIEEGWEEDKCFNAEEERSRSYWAESSPEEHLRRDIRRAWQPGSTLDKCWHKE